MTVVTISNDLSSTSFIISNDDNIINHVNGDAHDTLALIEMNVESDVLSWMIPYPHLTVGSKTSELCKEQLEDETFIRCF